MTTTRNIVNGEYGLGNSPNLSQVSESDIGEFMHHHRVLVTLSQRGFVKRIPVRSYAQQHRGGKGVTGMPTREQDAVRLLVTADTHDNLLFFTSRGRVFSIKCHETPDSSRISKGLAVVNLFPIAENEKVTAILAFTVFNPETYLLMATRRGEIKRVAAEHCASVRSNGIIAMDLETNDELVNAVIAKETDDVIIVTRKAMSIRFPVSDVFLRSRTAGGVRGIRLHEEDELVFMDVSYPGSSVLVVTENGYGKLTLVNKFRCQKRAGSGIQIFRITEQMGKIAGATAVNPDCVLMIISANGNVISMPVREKDNTQGISISSRLTMGVKVMGLDPGDKVVSVTSFSPSLHK